MAEKVYYCTNCQNGTQYPEINDKINALLTTSVNTNEYIKSEFYQKAYNVFNALQNFGDKDDYQREPHNYNFLLQLKDLKDELIYHNFYDDIKNALKNNEGCWKKEKNGSRWWFSFNDGTWPANTWIKYDNQYYYFDGSGWMVTGVIMLNGHQYSFNSNGSLIGTPANTETISYSNDSNINSQNNIIYGSYWVNDLKPLLQNIKIPSARFYEKDCCDCHGECSSHGWYCPSYQPCGGCHVAWMDHIHFVKG